MGKEGMGSPGDMRDRFRNAYKPGANKPIPSPLDSLVNKVGGMMKKKAPATKKGK